MSSPTTPHRDAPPPSHGWKVEWLDETASTNLDLLRRCAEGAEIDGVALAALYQRAGRGRLDRRWDAPAGTNLLVSLGFERSDRDPGRTMRSVALAVVQTAHRYGLAAAALKWPNDVLVDDRKLAGLLAERHESGAVVVGVGLNVNWAPPGSVRLADAASDAGELPVDAVLDDLLTSLVAVDDDPASIDVAYRASLATLGQRVRVQLSSEDLIGTAVDITGDGQLVVEADGRRHIVSAGDVRHLRPA